MGVDQRPIGIFVVLVEVSEQKLPECNYVIVIKLQTSHITLPLPVDLRLADAIGETEGFNPVEICCPEPTLLLERRIPSASRGSLHKSLETARFREEHHHDMRHVSARAPLPLRRSVASHIAQSAGTIFFRHSRPELLRKFGQNQSGYADHLETRSG